MGLQVVSHFEPAGAAMLLEEEIREALVGTAGTVTGDLCFQTCAIANMFKRPSIFSDLLVQQFEVLCRC